MAKKAATAAPQTDSERNLAAAMAVSSTVLVATGIAQSSAALSGEAARAKAIEVAMMAALKKAQAEGVTDPTTLRTAMLMARDRVRAA